MRTDIARNKIILALQQVIVGTFTQSEWTRLGYMLDRSEIITGHPRLLRSLTWGDDDYGQCVFDVLEGLLDPNLTDLEKIEEFSHARDWLKQHDPSAFEDLYLPDLVSEFTDVSAAGVRLSVPEFVRHVERMRHAVAKDPEQAIGSTKELLETTFKAILGDSAQTSQEDINTLLKQTINKLKLADVLLPAEVPGREAIQHLIKALNQIVLRIAELRNLYGTGHGRSQAKTVDIAYARLVVNAGVAVAGFFIEMWETNKEIIP